MTHVQILKIPAIGQTFSRGLMPQLSDHLDDFLKFLDDQEIYHYEMPDIDASKLKSTQANGFDYDKIMSMPQGSHKIIISNDMHVIDGHHRWLAAHNRDGIRLCAHKINLPILDAVAMAKRFIASKELQEGITHKEFQPMVDSFVDFASNELGIKSLPGVKFKQSNDEDEQPSFGGYSPGLKIITISTKNRHPMDIFRTLAHELVHAKQDEDGRLSDVAKEGSTGSDCENEANSQAGVIMRKYAKKARHMFNSANLDEEEENLPHLDFDKHIGKTFRITDPEGDPNGEGFSIVTPENGAAWSGPKAWKDRPEYHDVARENFNKPGWLGHKHGQITRSATKLKLNEMFQSFFEDTPSDREWGTESLTRKYKKDTPGQDKELEEDGRLTTATNVGLPDGADGIGPEFAVSNFGPGGLGSPFSRGYGPYESADKGLLDMGTVPKQGKEEVAEEERPGLWANIRAKRARGEKMRKPGSKGAPTDADFERAKLEEATPAWTRKEGQDPKGGLNKKGIASYRRANPGSKLSMAVTTEPSKLKKGSKKWKRRKSFCARMGGVPGPMKDEKGRPTRKALALRKWNCE